MEEGKKVDYIVCSYRDEIDSLTNGLVNSLKESACTLHTEDTCNEGKDVLREKIDKHIEVIDEFINKCKEVGEHLKDSAKKFY